MLAQIFYPTVALALTGGPSQPEMQGFEPIGTTNMVDLSSGSFTYNIPLMDVEGYPINLSYHSGITMDQEASWVGLGWNINLGEINRQMRGLPDDFQGDTVTQSYNMKDNLTVGFNLGVNFKLFGLPITVGSLAASAGIFYNNYKGPGMTFGITPSLSSGASNKGVLTGSLGLNFNSQSGLDVSPSIGYAHEVSQNNTNSLDAGIKVGTSYNSRAGLKGISMTKELGLSATDLPKDDSRGDRNGEGSVSASSYISFSAPSYTPTITMPINNTSITLQATLGVALFGGHPNTSFSGFFTDQTLATSKEALPAFGYMYADGAHDNPYALHDFNREKDIPFQPNIANLPITNFTYDLFSINGQGVSGQFRPFRGDVGVLYDHENYNSSFSGDLGVEIGIGDLVHNGIDVSVNSSNTVTDKWTGNNDFGSIVDFQSLIPGNTYEPFYIKSIGEKTINDTTYYNKIAGTNPIRVHLDMNGSTITARKMFDYGNSVLNVNGNLIKTQREKRNQSTSILNAAEASELGLDKTIDSYPYDTNVYYSCAYSSHINHIKRITWPAHHMSEITVTNPDGKRYVYGLPAYNLTQKEATFSINSPTNNNPANNSNYYKADSTNVVGYSNSGSNPDNSTKNNKGLDNYFNEQTIPSYSHSFLLTGVLSPDYVDLTGDGITDDDLGEAVKINYTQIYSRAKPFNWRTPFDLDSANYQVGLLSTTNDDKGNYIYGEKEVWYAHSIESKTMVAQFILQDRYDGFGVKDENGGIDTSKHLKCIKEIDLYSKADLIKNGVNAVPIKTVHFQYSYALCPGVYNSDAESGAGKLTLTKVYFTYGNNTEGSLNSYTFTYPTDAAHNPRYSHNRFDRWGYYKYNPAGMLPNEDFPYTLQDSVRDNIFCSAWDLTNITLPSGGSIKVNYEPNDYAYVQNQRANQMFIIKGMGNNPYVSVADSTNNILYTYSGTTVKFNDWIYVQLPTPIKNDQDFYDKYLAGIDSSSGGNSISKLYFRMMVNVGSVGSTAYEYVPGYADIAPYQTGVSGYKMINSQLGAIQLSEVSSGDAFLGTANPIALASWQFLRLNLPQDAYPGSQVTGSVLSIIEFLFGIIPTVVQTVEGFDQFAAFNHFGKYTAPSYSYIRLDNPNHKKYGGGARVKEIQISDNWSSMVTGSDQSSFQYGQTFNYTNTLPNGQVVSSGVATYEPIPGGDENPLRQPLPYDEKTLLAPNNAMYTETPLGENLYPSAAVVYSKVTVANLPHKGVVRTGTGYTVNEFYTAHDFPVLNYWTDAPYIERFKPSVLSSLFSLGVQDFTTASQGFSVEVNDMAGKEKSQKIYDQNGALISSVVYNYQVDNASSPTLHLNNNVKIVNPDGTIGTASIGKDIDVWEDMREQETKTLGLGVDINDEAFVWPFPPIPIVIAPLIFATYNSEDTRFRSAVTTKYIYRSGLVSSITKTQNGSTVTTQNLLYDGETGDVLLTKTNNEFDAPIYNFTYPAHWVYDGMGLAYRNIGAEVNVTSRSTGTVTSPSASSNIFAPGDELECVAATGALTKAWVTQPQAADSLVLMDSFGNPVQLSGNLVKVIRSGRRNMASVPVGTLTTMISPISGGGTEINITNSNEILQASASLFNDAWKIPYESVETPVCVTTATRGDTCLAQFLDSIIAHHQLFATLKDSIHLGKYVRNSSCHADSAELYYALSESKGMDQMSGFQAQLGNSVLTISSPTGGKIYMDSLTPYYVVGNLDGPPSDLSYFDSISSSGCLNLWIYRFRAFGGHSVSLAATACLTSTTCHDSCENLAVNNKFNPYAQGMKGNWRPQRNYVYYDSRSPGLASTQSNIWNTGVFNHFNPIWANTGGTIWQLDTTDKNWTWTSQITMYDQKGNEVEDEDALDRYSSALYGYMKSLPVAVASNAKYKDIAYDGFEDYGFTPTCNASCDNSHFSYISYIGDTTSTEAHTGKYSLKISAGDSAVVFRSIAYYNGAIDSIDAATHDKFILLNGGDLPEFSPDSGNYLLSAWVKEAAACGVAGYTKDSIVVRLTGGSSSVKYTMKPSGPVIEGWQRFESRFKVPGKNQANTIYVKLVAGTNTAYYDDIRIEPFAAEMKTYVYDPSSLRLLATLDENNYATIYEYNDEGILMRVKKETERGVMTIKESRSSYKRNQ
ncbi:MAG TPA: hypothetical protein VK783_00825 [Bacteroidia bacterium]|nr:hypothetical protein [Bacteroidia bacterium]